MGHESPSLAPDMGSQESQNNGAALKLKEELEWAKPREETQETRNLGEWEEWCWCFRVYLSHAKKNLVVLGI